MRRSYRIIWLSVFLWAATPSVAQKALPPNSRLEFAQVPFEEIDLIPRVHAISGSDVLFGADVCPVDWVSGWEELAPNLGLNIKRAFRTEHPGLITSAPAFVYLTNPGSKVHSEVVLEGLFGDGSRLEGPYVRAGSDRIDGVNETARSLSQGPDYRFLPDTTASVACYSDVGRCSKFDAVNAYYHTDKFVREFWVGRMNLDIGFQTDVRVHLSGDGAYASAIDHVMKFRLGDIFMKNAALSNDLILHEYAHLVASDLGFNPTSDHSDEARALSEAYADYFTASYTNDARIGEWVVTCPDRDQCIGPENDTEIRTLELDPDVWSWRYGFPSDTLQYGFCLRFHTGDLKCKASYNNFADRYVWGMIWAAALWDLRERVGADVADRLALGAVRRHRLEDGFIGAARDLLDADLELFDGRYKSDIYTEFGARKFVLPYVDSVSETPTAASFDVQFWPNPSTDVIQMSFKSESPFGGSVTLYDVWGREVGRQLMGPGPVGRRTITLPVSALRSGQYVVALRVGVRSQHVVITVSK